jgi:hypothetical protein
MPVLPNRLEEYGALVGFQCSLDPREQAPYPQYQPSSHLAHSDNARESSFTEGYL